MAIGVQQVAYTESANADGVGLYFYPKAQYSANGVAFILVTAVVQSPNVGNVNTIELVDENGTVIPNQVVTSGNSGPGKSVLQMGDVVEISVPLPQGVNLTQNMKVQTSYQTLASSSANVIAKNLDLKSRALNDTTNANVGTTVYSVQTQGNNINLQFTPNQVYLTATSPLQYGYLYNIGDLTASQIQVSSSSSNVRVTAANEILDGQKVIKVTYELIDSSVPSTSTTVTVTAQNPSGQTETSTGGMSQNVNPDVVPPPTPSSSPSISIAAKTDIYGNLNAVMMGNWFQFTATITSAGTSSVTAAFVNPAIGVISSDPNSCNLDFAGTTSCTFTVETGWNVLLANSLSNLAYQINITATNNATLVGNPLPYTQFTPTVYLAATQPGAGNVGVTWGTGGVTATTRFSVGKQAGGSDCPNGEETVVDSLTNRMWVKTPTSTTYTWANAAGAVPSSYCGYTNWRLPTMNELNSMVNYAAANPAEWLMYGDGNSGAPNCSGACFSNLLPIVDSFYWSVNKVGNNAFGFWLNKAQGTYVNPGETWYVWSVRSI